MSRIYKIFKMSRIEQDLQDFQDFTGLEFWYAGAVVAGHGVLVHQNLSS